MTESGRKAKGMKRSQPKRDWTEARAKVDAAPCCRGCGAGFVYPLQAAHIIGRVHDKRDLDGRPRDTAVLKVEPVRIVPLCAICHGEYDRHERDILPCLDRIEQAQAVLDAGSLESARRRLAPTLYRQERETDAA